MGGIYYTAPSAVITGNVTIGENVTIWHNVTIRGDLAPIRIGKNTNLQDNVVVHCSHIRSVVIGDNVSVGHGAIVHGCTVKDYALIGMGAIVMDGAVVGEGAIVGAGALVTYGMQIPDGYVAYGNPAKVIRKVTEEERTGNRIRAERYVNHGKEQLECRA